MIDSFIIQDANVLDRVIIDDEITISYIPEVQILALLLEQNKVFEQFKK